MAFHFASKRLALSPTFLALAAFLSCLFVTGGASRSDVWGQVFIRAICWVYLAGMVLFASPPPFWRGRAVGYFLLGALALVVVQLIPIPPAWWSELPGRATFGPAAAAAQADAWRPIAIVPSAAMNAAHSLVVPIVTYLLMAGSARSDDGRLVGLLLCVVLASTLLGLAQLTGVPLSDPLVNGNGQASGTFANRNHFALFLAMGCLLAPVWAFSKGARFGWRVAAAFATVPLMLLTILASGSRAGLIVGTVGVAGGLAMVWRDARAALRAFPRWAAPALGVGFVLATGLLVLVSVNAERAFSISRFVAFNADGELRRRALPTVLAMVRSYFPVGAGFGGFDTLFRVHEPVGLLKPTHFNRAHDDFLELVLDGGLPAALLMGAGLAWWLWATILAWRSAAGVGQARLGSLMIFLMLVASAFDYPLRTPLMLSLLIIAGTWLSDAASDRRRAPLPAKS